MLKVTRIALIIANILNWVSGVFFIGLVALSFSIPDIMTTLFPNDFFKSSDAAAAFQFWFPLFLIFPVLVIPSVHIIFSRLVAMLDDLIAGISFSAQNSNRLLQVAWSLLYINFIDLVYGWISYQATVDTGEYFGWSLSLTSWFAVLLIFVLAEIFKQGAIMRDDLEGTI